MWQLNDEHGLRSGPNLANEAKQQGGERTTDKKNQKQNNRNRQRQRYMPEGGGDTSPHKCKLKGGGVYICV